MQHLQYPLESADLEDDRNDALPGSTPISGEFKASPFEPSLPRTPKLTQAEKRGLIYPYYAGFSEAFVTSMLDCLGVTERSCVLDPWTGSGTTTYVASMLGVASTGYDINPALTIVAAARASTMPDLADAQAAWDQLSAVEDDTEAPVVDQCATLYRRLVARDDRPGHRTTSRSEALILCALFDTLRKNYQHAKTSNPAWFSSRARAAPPVPLAAIATQASVSFSSLVERQSRSAPFVRRVPRLYTADFLALRPRPASFDAVITSPPYLTRLDYVKATLPELTLLARLGGPDLRQLRTQMMGSPLVGPTAPPVDPRWGPTALELLHQVRHHPSKASGSYYLRFFLKYFAQLSKSLKLLSRSLKPGGKGCVVVQTSHYKEIFIDLPGIVVEMAASAGLPLLATITFPGNRSIVTINSRAIMTANASPVESAIILGRPARI